MRPNQLLSQNEVPTMPATDKKTLTAIQKTILRIRRGEVKSLKQEALKFGNAFKKSDLVEVLKDYDIDTDEDTVLESLETFFSKMSEAPAKLTPDTVKMATDETTPSQPDPSEGPGNTEPAPRKTRSPKQPSTKTTPGPRPPGERITAKNLKEPPRTDAEKEYEQEHGKLYAWTISKLTGFFEQADSPVLEEDVRIYLDSLTPFQDGHPRWGRYTKDEREYLTNFLVKKVSGLNKLKLKNGTYYSFNTIPPDFGRPEKDNKGGANGEVDTDESDDVTAGSEKVLAEGE